jgi:hypothetical protein
MSKVTQTDIDSLIKEMNAFYFVKGKCKATPEQLSLLLDRLEAYTDEVSDAADDTGIDEDANVMQWSLDMASWQQRMGRYREILDDVPDSQWRTASGCKAIEQSVTSPLLRGVFYEVLPGIVYSDEEKARVVAGGASNPKPPDVHVPFTLGNQVVVYQEHQDYRMRMFWSDLKEAALDLLRAAKDLAQGTLLPIGWMLFGAAAVIGVGYYIWTNSKKKKKLAAA